MWKLMLGAFALLYPFYGYYLHTLGEATPVTYILVGMSSLLLIDIIIATVGISFAIHDAYKRGDDNDR